jgi:diaminohydroxyphosphoribosylaminopyrimidine deaminase/5-amino-6-(5-phosphoribosylamino)uracil reductase
MSAPDDARHMGHALALARRGLGRVWPNPSVGCVIVHGGVVVGRGVTAPGGRPHAEPQALAQAGAAARGATAYVTLEPCAHHGHTPPCAEALVAAGIARVVTALEDPDPRVSGGGHAILRAAGIAVATGVLGAEARALQRGFLTRITQGRPMVTLKLATSLDGRIATSAGESRWITGPQARARVHLMRASHDAVLVAGGTARADDPELTVRGLGIASQPLRIVAARRLDLPRGGRLQASIAQGPLWLLHGAAAPAEARAHWSAEGARLIVLPEQAGGLDPAALLAALGAEGLTRVFCEGGGQFAAALLQAGLVDRLEVFGAGLALGADGRPGLGPLGLTALKDAPRFRLVEARTEGPDLWSSWETPQP